MPNIIKDKNGTYPQVFKRVGQSDTKITPIQLNKTFTMRSGSLDDNHLSLEANYVPEIPEINPFTNEAYYFNQQLFNPFGKNHQNGSFPFNIYYSINHLFYKHKDNALQTHGLICPPAKSTKILYRSASVFSIPQTQMGLTIKRGSFIYSGSYNLHSDEYENIIDSGIITSSFVGDELFYEGFNEYFDLRRITEYVTASNVTFPKGVTHSDGDKNPIGYSAYFSGSGYMEISNEQNINNAPFDRDHDYALSFYIYSGSNTGTTNQLIIGKQKDKDSDQYPFKIELSGSNQLVFSIQGTKVLNNQITSSAFVSSSWTHVVCQKTGSTMEMYVNASLHSSLTSNSLLSNDQINNFKTSSVAINNIDPIKFGGNQVFKPGVHDGTDYFNGYLDEIRIYNKALNQSNVNSLADRTEGGGLLQTNRVGNAFHENGLFVVTSPDVRYDDAISFAYSGSYKSTTNIFEFSTLCKVEQGDFNLTTNHSSTNDDNETYMSHVTSSAFEPYITTIGLYNEYAELLAIGKFATPVKNRNDIDMNFLVRCDLDQDRFANIVDDNEFD